MVLKQENWKSISYIWNLHIFLYLEKMIYKQYNFYIALYLELLKFMEEIYTALKKQNKKKQIFLVSSHCLSADVKS